MKVLNIGYGYGSFRGLFLFPSDIESADEFADYVTDNQADFLPLVRLSGEHSVYPYYIEGEVETVFIQGGGISYFLEDDVTILTEKEYGERLRETVAKVCVGCANYHEDKEGDNLRGHWEKLCLDGTCWNYEAIEEEEKDKNKSKDGEKDKEKSKYEEKEKDKD